MKDKLLFFVLLIVGIFSILVGSIAYYRIVVKGNINGIVGNAVFVLKDENSNVWNNKEIDLGKINPGDSGSFTITMDASSSNVDMYATLELDREALPTNLKFYTTSDHKSELHKYYSFLEKDGTSSETLTIYWYWNPYIDDEEDSKFINIENMEANIKVSAVQISEYAMMKNGYSYTNATEFWNNTYSPYIRTITFGNDLSNLPSVCNEENLCWDISYDSNQNKKVYGYLIDSGLSVSVNNDESVIKQPLYNLYIVSEVPIFAPYDCSRLFYFPKYENNKAIANLESINFNNNFNTSKVTNMGGMFNGCYALKNLDLSSFNTSNVTNMGYMFNRNEYITNVDLSNFNTSKVTNMRGLFYYCMSLETSDLSSFNTSKVIDMYGMFYYCKSLISLDIKSFDTSKVTNMCCMFTYCYKLTTLDLSGFNTSNVTDMSNMFQLCASLTSLNVNSFNTSKVTNMESMFSSCSKLTTLDLSKFNTSNVTTMRNMFGGLKSLTTLNISSFNTSKVTNMEHMFYECYLLKTLDLSSFNTSNVTDMEAMLRHLYSLESIDLSNFDTSKVTDMKYMFAGCYSLTTLDISSFDTSKVTDMNSMFSSCNKLQTTINIMNPNVTDYTSMFLNAAYTSNAKIILNYTAETESLVDNMILAKPSNSNVAKGKQI